MEFTLDNYQRMMIGKLSRKSYYLLTRSTCWNMSVFDCLSERRTNVITYRKLAIPKQESIIASCEARYNTMVLQRTCEGPQFKLPKVQPKSIHT